jgi:protein phosphatase
MGGHRGGDVASEMSVEALGHAQAGADGATAVAEAIREANQAILDRGDAERDLQGMGTTVTALFIDGDKGHVLHVGDSRAYLFRDSALQQLTEDHTMVQELVRQGRLSQQDAERHPQRSMLTRAVGVDADVDVDDLTLDLHPGDRFLVCSDGLTGMLSDEGIAHVLGTTPGAQEAADRLVALANEAGGEDNITVIVVDALPDASDGLAPADVAQAGQGDPNVTAQIPAVSADGPDAGERAEARSPKPRARRAIAALLVALLVGGAAVGYASMRSFLDGQWYVGVAGGQVAVYRGVPSILGVRLAHLDLRTAIPAGEAARLPGREPLSSGITARSRADAITLVNQIRLDLCRSANATCVPGQVR